MVEYISTKFTIGWVSLLLPGEESGRQADDCSIICKQAGLWQDIVVHGTLGTKIDIEHAVSIQVKF